MTNRKESADAIRALSMDAVVAAGSVAKKPEWHPYLNTLPLGPTHENFPFKIGPS